jgi:ABC-2 type transport system ATP-binding protein
MPLIEAKNLSKSYGAIRAVHAVSFTVDRGEVVGFLGPNGAGKSTTMKMLTGHLRADEGAAVIAGFDVADQAVQAKQHLGYSIPPLRRRSPWPDRSGRKRPQDARALSPQ